LVHGSDDEYGAIEKVKTLVASLPGENHLIVVEGAEHFFKGKLEQVDEPSQSGSPAGPPSSL